MNNIKSIISSIGDAARRVATRIVPGWLGYAATRITDVALRRPARGGGVRLAPAASEAQDGEGGEALAIPPNIEIVDADAPPISYRSLFFGLEDAVEYARDIPVAVRILRLKIGGRIVYIVDVQGSDGDDVV